MAAKSGRSDWNRLVGEDLRAILETIRDTDVEEIEISTGDRSIRIRLGDPGRQTAGLPAEEPVAAAPQERIAAIVHSDRVGTFYRSAKRDDPPLKREQDSIQAGEAIGFIDSLDVPHEVAASSGGTVLRFLVGDGVEVEYGEALAMIEPGIQEPAAET